MALLRACLTVSLLHISTGELPELKLPMNPWLKLDGFNFETCRTLPSHIHRSIANSLATVSVISKDIDWTAYKQNLPSKIAEAERRVKDHVAGIAAAFQSFPSIVPAWEAPALLGSAVASKASDKLRRLMQEIQDRVAGSRTGGHLVLDVAHSEPDVHSPVGFSETDLLRGAVATDVDGVNRRLTERVLSVMAKTDWCRARTHRVCTTQR